MNTPMTHTDRLMPILNQMHPITLEEMSGIRLMNRTDKKFVTNMDQLERMLHMIRDDYYVQDIDGIRAADYQTIYWDTEDHYFYQIHHNGKTPRQKVRVRTYMDSNLSFLEVKNKNNHGRTKKVRMKVVSPELEGEAEEDSFLQTNVSQGLDNLLPSVKNRFHRITLVNRGKTERLTIDFDIFFENYETHNRRGTGDLVIIELKRDGNVPSPILAVLRQLRIHPFGFSKYCIGSLLTNQGLKQNRFKNKLHEICKRANLFL